MTSTSNEMTRSDSEEIHYDIERTDLYVCIKPIGPSISYVHFKNSLYEDIDIPRGTAMYEFNGSVKVLMKDKYKGYFICYTDKYELHVPCGSTVLDSATLQISPNHNWNIKRV